jgi:hypothetical protein
LVAWLHRFFAFTTSKRHIAAELLKQTDRSNPLFRNNRTRVIAAGRPLLAAAQHAGEVRDDLTLEQILDMIVAIATIHGDTGYTEPILQAALDGLRPPADPIISIPETKATLLRSIKPMTKTKAPATREIGCQRVRATRRMPITDSRAPVRSHQPSRHERTGLAARDSPARVDRFASRFLRFDCSFMPASYPPGSRYGVLLCVYIIARFQGTALYPRADTW